jgi:hypothetical protein
VKALHRGLPLESEGQIDDAIARFAGSGEWTVIRQHDGREKKIDLKRYVRSLARDGSRLRIELLHTQEGAARPGEVVQSLLGVEAKRLVKESVRLGIV